MVRIVLGNLRSGTPADHARLAGTALVAATGTVMRSNAATLLVATRTPHAGRAAGRPVG